VSHTHTTNRVLAGLLGLSMIGTCAASARAADDQQTADKPAETKTRVTIYPILIKAPIFGASVDLPSLPSGGGGESGDVSGSTDTSLNAAYMAGVLVEADRWFAEASGAYAALTASRATPRVNIDSKAYFYGGRGGVRILGGFSATGGFRYVSLDLDATLTLPLLNKTIEGTATRGIWDPLVGVDWRRTAGSWTIDGNFQGGGFGVGADVDLSAEIRARWRPAKHFEIRAGYSFLYLELTVANVSIGSFQRTLVAKQSLHGPEIGFGIVF
jgi:hypothetical protein